MLYARCLYMIACCIHVAMRCANASPSSTCCHFQWRRNLDTCNLPLSRHGNFNVSIAAHPHSSCKASHTRVRVERCSPMTPAASSSSSDINQPHISHLAPHSPLCFGSVAICLKHVWGRTPCVRFLISGAALIGSDSGMTVPVLVLLCLVL